MKRRHRALKSLGSARVYRVISLAALLSACTNPSANPDYIPQGTLSVTLLDQTGTPAAGADFRVLAENDAFVWAHGVSGNDGRVVFDAQTNPITPTTSVGLLGGNYRGQLSPPAGYLVPSTQVNPAKIQIMDKQTTSLTMRLARGP